MVSGFEEDCNDNEYGPVTVVVVAMFTIMQQSDMIVSAGKLETVKRKWNVNDIYTGP